MNMLTRPEFDEYRESPVDFDIAPFGPGRVSSELGARRGFCVSLKDRVEKKCPRCERMLERGEFAKNGRRPDGLQAYCRACQSEQSKVYYSAHKEAMSERNRAWRLANPERHKANYQRWAAENPERTKENNRRWHQENREQYRARGRAWYKANRDEVLEARRTRHREKAVILNERQRARRKVNLEHVRATERAYRSMHAEVYRDRAHRYRVAIRKLYIESVMVTRLAERDRNRCGVCGKYVDVKDRSIDHIIPVSLGGEHSYANTRLAHRRCNSSRSNRGPAQMRLLP